MSMIHTDAVFFEDDKAFETWLGDNASTATHVWVRMAKKGTGVTSIDWTRAVDVALCFGWIDGISRRLDDDWYVQRFTPRRARSVWSKINRELGWEPTVSWDEGIAETIDWYAANAAWWEPLRDRAPVAENTAWNR